MTGEWDRADQVIHDSIAIELRGHWPGSQIGAWLAGLRGDIGTASDLAEEYRDRTQEDAQDQAGVALCDAIIAATQSRYADALRNAEAVIAQASALGIGHLSSRGRGLWRLGVPTISVTMTPSPSSWRCWTLTRSDTSRRCCVPNGSSSAPASTSQVRAPTWPAFDAAVAALRQGPSPFHLAHGLLDHAEYLTRSGTRRGRHRSSSKPARWRDCAANRCSTASTRSLYVSGEPETSTP